MANNDGRNTPPQRSVLWVILAGILLVAVAWGYRAKWASQLPNPKHGPHDDRLFIDPKCLDFGEVWEDRQFRWAIPIENRSDGEIAIHEITSSCNCSSVEPRSLIIPARESREIRVTLDLSVVKTAKEYQAAIRDFHVMLSPRLEKSGGSSANRMGCPRPGQKPVVLRTTGP